MPLPIITQKFILDDWKGSEYSFILSTENG